VNRCHSARSPPGAAKIIHRQARYRDADVLLYSTIRVVIMKSISNNGRRNKRTPTKPKPTSAPASERRKKEEPPEPTANELMLEAWKRIYEARRERLL